MTREQKIQKRKSAQDIQDEIFRKMSVGKKIKLMSDWSAFCLKLNRLNFRASDGKKVLERNQALLGGAKGSYNKNGTRKTSQKNSSNSGQS